MVVLKRIFDVFSSFGLTVAILAFMFVVTLCGTVVQETTMSLREAQRTYFESWWLIHNLVGPINLPLPGGLTLMTALTINLICGGIVRLRWDKRRVPILVTHFGIAFLMIAGLVNFATSTHGLIALYEGDRGAEYHDSHSLEIVVLEPLQNGKTREYLVSEDVVSDMRPGEKLTVGHASLPFELDFEHFMPNSVIEPAGDKVRGLPVVDGYYLASRAPVVAMDKRSLPGCYAIARIPGQPSQTGILWEFDARPDFESQPWTIDAGGKRWGVKLRKKVYTVPFAVRVDDFRAEFHPRTSMPSLFESHVTVFDGDAEVKQRIYMNNPLRKDGFTFFQTSWGPQEGGPNQARMYSVFEVVTNPADAWPEYACWVIGFGLLWHFGWMLIRFIDKEQRARVARQAALEEASS